MIWKVNPTWPLALGVPGCGIYAGYSDEAYAAKGCTVTSRGDTISKSEVRLVLVVKKSGVTTWKINMDIQITHLERKMISQNSPMIMFHVNLPGCIETNLHVVNVIFSPKFLFLGSDIFVKHVHAQ